MQCKRLSEWGNNLKTKVLNQNLQVQRYTSEHRINFKNTTINNIKKQIYIIQKLYANVRNYNESDIRRYLICIDRENKEGSQTKEKQLEYQYSIA